MTTAPSIYRVPGRPPRVGLTVQQYHRMIEAGILRSGDPIELLEGQLVPKDRSATGEDPMTVGNRHALAIEKLTDLNAGLKRYKCYIRIQLPVLLSKNDEPEPDGAIVRGNTGSFANGAAQPAEICCVIEIADSSLADDRNRKQRIYANAGIRQYLIINLVDNVVEEYTEPEIGRGRYARVTPFPMGKRLELQTASKPLRVAVGKLLA